MTPESLAKRGYYLFPVSPKKVPLIKGWPEESSVLTEKIDEWRREFPGCFWGIDCGKSHLIVVDNDQGKHPEALHSLNRLELEHGDIPETFTVRTLSGGYHYYFRGRAGNTASSTLGAGLDSRSVGGYVVAPCSPGYGVEQDSPVADAPEWLRSLLGKPREPKEALSVAATRRVEIDSRESITNARTWLKQGAPVAVEGQAGDQTTFRVACQVRDYGISEEECFDLLWRYWNEDNQPPWDPAELQQKVHNAYLYASNPSVGQATPQAAFEAYVDPDKVRRFTDMRSLRRKEMKIDYLCEGLIETPATGLVFGDPSAGKSFLAIDLACAVACGTSWMGRDVKQGIVVYFAGEGRHGIKRRGEAWARHHGTDTPEGFLWISEQRIEFTPTSMKEVVQELREIEETVGAKVELCVVDTLARHIGHGLDENSAKDTGSFINCVDWLRDQIDGVVAVVHHSGVAAKGRSRGSSAIKGAMDFEFKVSYIDSQRSVEWTKQKEGELPPAFGFKLAQVEIDDEGTTSAVPVCCEYDRTRGKAAFLSADARLAFDLLLFHGGANGKLLEGEWRNLFYVTLDGVELAESTKRSKFSRAKAKLLQASLIVCEGGHVSVSDLSDRS